ncbi:hypothetical protein CVT26_014154 [Gymnopilus dilepis]|uniref:Putative lipoate-protein ligase A n=1 Tax=Gymnopilus dilepis TaxID=231916 RepID=A0A409VUG5_9AGAR|nr:hypothetical protein CVT26_014154 [Gymnopilus dilepis]
MLSVATRLMPANGFHIGSLSPCLRRQALRSFSELSSGSGLPLSPNHDIYVSLSSDPYFNLTFEDWLFRHSNPSKPQLLIYRDAPCVVIGRNQNPWTEVNFSVLRARGVPFLRRRSGGGTVYHDMGNTNFSIHLPRSSFDRHSTGELVLRAVRSLGIDARLNERNDVCVGTDKMRSAYKIVSQRAYHHGTMLISTELETLGDVLRPEQGNIVTKGVGSVRSPVCNLQRFDPSLTHEVFTAAVITKFQEEYGVSQKPFIVHESESIKSNDYIGSGMAELATWDWLFGQTPEFTRILDQTFSWGIVHLQIRSKHGIIQDFSARISDTCLQNADLDAFCNFTRSLYQGCKYGFIDDLGDIQRSRTDLNKPEHIGAEWFMHVREVHSWLQSTLNIR